MSFKTFMAKDDRWQEYSRAIIFSFIGAPILTFLTCNSCTKEWSMFVSTSLVSAMMWCVMWIGNSELTHLISKWISWVEFPTRRFVVGMISTVIFTILLSIGLIKLWEYSMGLRFKTYYDFVIIALIITFLISFFLHGREFLIRWKKSAVEAEQYQKESVIAQYENLKNQVNPHFLFNSLNVLTNLVYTDQDKAAQFIKKMSEVYRYVLDTRNLELVSLSEEMAFTDSYIYLQKIRFGDNLRVNNQLNINDGKVIPLAIQMLVENAIKHNEVSEQNPLEISIRHEPNYIVVENTVCLRSNPLENNSGVGLENVRKRYEFLTDIKVEINKTSERFTVKIPLIINEQDA